MIKLRDAEGNNYNFELTKFPDGTTQCWKINPEPKKMTVIEVLWMFENEAEIFQVCQLGTLLYKYFMCFPTLVCPYFPTARQDKKVSNDMTFSRDVLLELLKTSGYTKIKAYDLHSGSVYVESKEPAELLEAALQDGYDIICFPDKGAKERYSKLVPKGVQVIYGDKRRNQQTGAIEGLELSFNGTTFVADIPSRKILVFDDICDGGRTFTELSNLLTGLGVTKLGLAISHGIFSKGIDILFEAGYNKLYTTNSLLKNEAGYEWYNNINNTLDIIEVVK